MFYNSLSAILFPYIACIIQVICSSINLIPHLNRSSVGEVPSRLLKVLFALERTKWIYRKNRGDMIEVKKKKKEFIAMNATHLHEVDYCLDGILQSFSEEKDSLITFNNWLLRIYTSIFLILMPITLIQNSKYFNSSRNFQFYFFDFQIFKFN